MNSPSFTIETVHGVREKIDVSQFIVGPIAVSDDDKNQNDQSAENKTAAASSQTR